MSSVKSRADRYPSFVLVALAISGFIFALFLTNVLLGKYSASLSWSGDLRQSLVVEFLLLLSSVTFFVIASLGAERAVQGKTTSAVPEKQKENTSHVHKK